jgi:IS30 family transposase
MTTFVDGTTKLLREKVLGKRRWCATMRALSGECTKTPAADNGSDCKSAEFDGHKGLPQKPGCDIYFAHLFRSWERGLNKHNDGLIRQYPPEGTSLEGLSWRRLDGIIDKIDNRPRKVL